MENNLKPKWHENKITVILLMVFIAPIGLFLMWKNNLWRKSDRIIITIVVIGIFINAMSDIARKSTRINNEQELTSDTTSDSRPNAQKEFEELKTKTIHSLSNLNESMDESTTKKLQETIQQIKGEVFSKINYVKLYNLYNNIN